MKIKEINIAHTPSDWEEIHIWLNELPSRDGIRSSATAAALMAWNLAVKITNKEK